MKDSGTKPHPTTNVHEPQPTEVERRVTITFAQLVNNFTNTFKGVAKRQGLSDPGYLAISVDQMKSFLDEFSKRWCVHACMYITTASCYEHPSIGTTYYALHTCDVC